jgi:peptide/nickel transport system permease protein
VQAYIIRRALLIIPTLVGVAIIIFVLMNLVRGDIAELLLVGEGYDVSQEQIDALRHELGLDRPLLVRFGDWLWGILRGDLGMSFWTKRSVISEISVRLHASLEIAIGATLISLVFAIPLGTLAALKQDSWIDYAVRVFSIAGLAIPSFWLGILILLALLIFFTTTPTLETIPFLDDPWENMKKMIWPIVSVGYRYSAVATRMTRAQVLEVLREDYIRTARAKGLFERLVIMRHALKNALLPVITIVGIEFAFLIGGLVVTETVFNVNGIGFFLVDAVTRKDYFVVQGIVLVISFAFVFTNLMVDITYAWLDPRIRYQ